MTDDPTMRSFAVRLVVAALVAVLIFAALLATGCTAPSAGVPADPNDEQAELARLVQTIWPAGSLPSNVTWQVGEPVDAQTGEALGGYAQGYCVLTWCTYFVTIRSGYVNAWTVAHEGGHIVCASRWQDWSEQCADAVAAEVLP